MQVEFVHLADVHLGYEQYGSVERYNDFGRAFGHIIDYALAQRVRFVVIAGDLFNKRAIDARTLMQAHQNLARLKDAGIPAVAIEGNHDRTYYREGVSWLQFLAWEGLICLLDPIFQEGKLVLAPVTPESMRGSYIDIEGIRIYGVPWAGASTLRVVEALALALAQEEAPQIEYRLLLMHTGLDGMVPHMPGLPTYEQLQPLRGKVDYLGLGHVHKHYEVDGWVYNPGSTETWSADEVAWTRGFYHVAIDTSAIPKHRAIHKENQRRPFIRLPLHVDVITEPEVLYARADDLCRREAHKLTGASPVVELTLLGVLGFDSTSLDRARLERIIREHFEPLIVRIHDNTRASGFEPETDDLNGQDRHDRLQMELRIFKDLLSRDGRYQPQAETWARLLAELKTLALQGEPAENIFERLRAARIQFNALVEAR